MLEDALAEMKAAMEKSIEALQKDLKAHRKHSCDMMK